MLGKTLVNLGLWFNKHFPEKMSTDEVYGKLAAMELRLHDITAVETQLRGLQKLISDNCDRIVVLEKKAETLTSENTALKAASAMRMRSSIPMPGR